MNIWWIMLIAPFLLCLFARFYEEKDRYQVKANKASRVMKIIAIAILVCIAGLRKGFVDTRSYRIWFNETNRSVFEYLRYDDKTKDKGFSIFMRIIKVFTDNSQIFIFICSLIIVACIGIILLKYCEDNFYIAIFVYVASGCYMVSMNGVRQSLAGALLFICCTMIIDRKWYIYIPIVILVSTIHGSAIIFIPLYFLVNKCAWGKITKTFIITGIFIYLSYSVTGTYIASLLVSSNYEMYGEALVQSESGTSMVRVVIASIPLVLAYVTRNKKRREVSLYNMLVNFSVLNVIVMLLATKYVYFARLNIYFLPYSIILLCHEIKYAFEGKNRVMVNYMSLLLYCIYYWYLLSNYGALTLSGYYRL